MKKIPREVYKNILDTMPICCVDMVVHYKGKVLLVKRKDEPEKGEFWVPGGRIYKNERLADAVLRKVKEETGLDVKIIRQLGICEYFSNRANFGVETGTHAICLRYLVEPLQNPKSITLDNTSAGYKWIDRIDNDLGGYVKKIIEDSEVFKSNRRNG